MWRRKAKAPQERRGSPRRAVRWIGHYGTPTTPETTWSACAIENISAQGASTVVLGGREMKVGDPISIDVEQIGATPVGMRVHGIVRHASHRQADGVMVFGVELEFATLQERRAAEMLFQP